MKSFLRFPDPRIGTWSFHTVMDGGKPTPLPVLRSCGSKNRGSPIPLQFEMTKASRQSLRKDSITLLLNQFLPTDSYEEPNTICLYYNYDRYVGQGIVSPD